MRSRQPYYPPQHRQSDIAMSCVLPTLATQPYQFDPESDPEGGAPEEVQTLQLQQDISESLVSG